MVKQWTRQISSVWSSHCNRGEKPRVKTTYKVISQYEKYFKDQVKWWRITRWGSTTLGEVVWEGFWGAADDWKKTWGRKEKRWCIDPGVVLQVEKKQEGSLPGKKRAWLVQQTRIVEQANGDRYEGFGGAGGWPAPLGTCAFYSRWNGKPLIFFKQGSNPVYIKHLSDCCGAEQRVEGSRLETGRLV